MTTISKRVLYSSRNTEEIDFLSHISLVGLGKDSVYQSWKNSDLSWEEAVKPSLEVYRDWQKYLPWVSNQIQKNNISPERLLPWVEESKEDQKEGKLTLRSLVRKSGGDVNRLKLVEYGYSKNTRSTHHE